jgi:hypothetical protein
MRFGYYYYHHHHKLTTTAASGDLSAVVSLIDGFSPHKHKDGSK